MSNSKPTVVLVHGTLLMPGTLAAVIPLLLSEGIPVVAPAVPNRSLSGDAAYVASVLRSIDGPVVLVGHSYGGAVITVAGAEESVALVFLSAYVLEEGDEVSSRDSSQIRLLHLPSCTRHFPSRAQRSQELTSRSMFAKFPISLPPMSTQTLPRCWPCRNTPWLGRRLPRQRPLPHGRRSRAGVLSPSTTEPSIRMLRDLGIHELE